MFEHDDDIVERMIRQLRRPVSLDPGLAARVMGEIAAPAHPGKKRRWAWLAAAAAVLGAVVIAHPWTRGSGTSTAAFQFVLVAPRATHVELVGDFNDWDPARSPMRTAQGVWATVVPLAPGRYRYAFLVNGVEWRADPGAPAAKDDEFDTPSSVVTVGGRGS